jgi:hypothetical protein
MPNAALYQWKTVAVPTVFQKTEVSHYIARGSNVVILPPENLGHGMYYQYVDNMEFNQVGGYLGIIPYNFYTNPITQSFRSDTIVNNFKPELTAFCIEHNVSEIIYSSDTGKNVVDQLTSLRWNSRTVNGLTIIYVPATTHK